MTTPWRCFVAVPIDAELRRELEHAREQLRAAHPTLDDSWRWTVPAEWHVTLAFLGETDPTGIGRLTDAIEAVAAPRDAFILPTGELGVFPSPRAARVLWYGVHDPDGSLAAAIEELREALGLDPGPVHPHVTLARARHRHGAIADALLEGPPMPRGRLSVDRVRLYRSHTGAGPARYEVVAESILGGGLNGSRPAR